MGAIEEVHRVTEEILKVLDESHLERSQRITKINELIDKREKEIKRIKPPYSNEEMRMGKQIIELNEKIKIKMDQLYDRVKLDIVQFKQQKAQNRSYINQYGSLETTDGMYLDQKK